MASPIKRLALNASGPFYTTGDCLACGMPEQEAPELLASIDGDNFQTYFVRQPQTPEEVERACSAIGVCCTAALRYGGTNPAVIARLGNTTKYCDYLIQDGEVVLAGSARSRAAPWWKFWP
jgi:hypothetical protein